MSSIKLILLNIGWVALALGAYFLGKSDGEDASPVVGSTSKFDRTLFALREEGYPGRTPGKDDSSTNNLQAGAASVTQAPVSYTHLRAHETRHDLVCRLLLEKKK